MVAAERCMSYLTIPTEKETIDDELYIEKTNISDLNMSDWPSKGNIEFQNFSVQYRPNTDIVLKGISFIINSGEKVGIIGRTGSGKSTITLSLFRILEALSGRILIDNKDISKVPLSILRKKLTLIPQDSGILNGSLRYNIDPTNEFSKDEIMRVIKEIGLYEILNSKNIESEISNESLSAGEKQLICIARAILRRSKIIMIDEATANIDNFTEEKIQAAFKLFLSSSTILAIAHRIKTIIGYDKVLVLSQGEVVEYGPPKELVKNTKGVFYSLCKKSKINIEII